jgi:hypothetical protein
MSTRASDAEREAAVARLRQAAGEGRLSVEELTARVDAAYAATTTGELEALTADLPAAPARAHPAGRGTSFVLAWPAAAITAGAGTSPSA